MRILALVLGAWSMSAAAVTASGTIQFIKPHRGNISVQPVAYNTIAIDAATIELANELGVDLNAIDYNEATFLDDLDVEDERAAELVEAAAAEIEAATGEAVFDSAMPGLLHRVGGCEGANCRIYVEVSLRAQTMTLYVDGAQRAVWPVSTGLNGRTPRLNRRATGRVKIAHTSSRYPGGDWNGLGNMPYAVFFSDVIAIHGTPASNWKKLGRPASHGCIRLHPSNAAVFNALVRQYGAANTWLRVI